MTVISRLDAQLGLPEDEAMLLDNVRAFARDEIAPRAAHHDETKEFPWENVKGINALGLNAMFVPEAYGGAGLSYLSYLACVREISAACASTGIIWATNFHAIKPLIDFGTEEQKQRLLPRIAEGGLAALVITEPDAGSDATGMRTKFTPDGDDILVNGSKTFITNGDVADLYVIFGKWSETQDPKAAISCLILEKGTPGLSVVRLEDKMGHRASSTATLAFDNCRVPKANLLRGPGEGLKLLLASLNKSRPSVGAHALGIARAAFEEATGYINGRKQSGKKIIEFQGIQFLLADLASDLPGVLPPVLGVVGGASLPVGLAFAGWFERPGSKRAAIAAFAAGSAIATVLVAIGLEHRERGLRLFDPAVFYGGIGAAVFVAAAVSAAMWARRGLGDPSASEVTTDP